MRLQQVEKEEAGGGLVNVTGSGVSPGVSKSSVNGNGVLSYLINNS